MSCSGSRAGWHSTAGLVIAFRDVLRSECVHTEPQASRSEVQDGVHARPETKTATGVWRAYALLPCARASQNFWGPMETKDLRPLPPKGFFIKVLFMCLTQGLAPRCSVAATLHIRVCRSGKMDWVLHEASSQTQSSTQTLQGRTARRLPKALGDVRALPKSDYKTVPLMSLWGGCAWPRPYRKAVPSCP